MPITNRVTAAVTHVGLVLSVYSQEDRIMSDVWATGTYALVWNLTTGVPQSIKLYDSEFGGDLQATVDATPDIVARWDALQAAQEHAKMVQAEAEAQERAMERVLTVRQGALVTAIKGRKVPLNAVGTAEILRQNDYGWQILFRDSTTGQSLWSSVSNFMRIDRCLPDGKTWQDYEYDLEQVERAKEFNKGDIVKIKSTGITGLVFWKKEGRYGVSPSQMRNPQGRYMDAVWAGPQDLELL